MPIPTDQRDAATKPLAVADAKPLPEMNALFERSEGWIGADGAYSVALGTERTLWLFSDTWVGSIRAGKRVDAVMVNNSVALQDRREGGTKLKFVIRRNADDKPVALLTPADGHGWYWLQGGASIDKQLVLFMAQVEKTKEPGTFGFRQVGQWLGVVANSLDDPTAWKVEQHKLPCTIFTPKRQLSYGAATLLDGDYLYIFGSDEDIKASGPPDRYLTVARVRTSEVSDFDAWRFYHAGKWEADFHSADRVVDHMASECSVSFLAGLKQYVLVYTERGLSPKIRARTAPNPWGPWSAPTTVYECPEMGKDKKLFCYAAKAHPSLAADDELVISYVTNSFDLGQIIGDASLYWPRFVRVKVRLEE